jgi:hypothetical protein
METNDSNVFFTGSLLRLDETSGAVNADNETACDFGIEGAGVTSLLASTTTLVSVPFSNEAHCAFGIRHTVGCA